MKIGKYAVHIIESGYFGLDGGAMFGIVPKPLWERTNPPDKENRIKLATRNLLLISDSKKILVDTGMGKKWSDKNKQIYDIDQKSSSLEQSLSMLNLKAEDITDVILTHLHFDHTGGSTVRNDGRLEPAFPNAIYYVQKQNFQWAINPSERDAGSYIKENFMPLRDAGVLLQIEGEKKLDDEIDFIIVNGHTFGQQLLKISDSVNTILYCCDLFPTTSHIPLPYVMGYDLQPLVTVDEKKKILKSALDEDWKLFFEHDPETVYATVSSTEKGIHIKDKFQGF
ncbi:MAG TPA: MBL fold metallo-hydrolase [Ignavibacteriaceae bacterium]|nr:MBL fold metallo-hydrolase [Ignavibacteriaceae bacterium]